MVKRRPRSFVRTSFPGVPDKPVQAGMLGLPRSVPPGIPPTPYAETGEPGPPARDLIRTPDAIARMREAGAIAAQVLRRVGQEVAPGVTTDHLDAIGHAEYIRLGAYPSTLNYRGYPKSLCTSVNEVICHGIPDSRPLEEGDIVNVDVTAYYKGVHGDTSAMFFVGSVDELSKKLVRVTRECLYRGIDAVKPGAPVNAIGKAIQLHAEANQFSVVRSFIGHGIGEGFHTALAIPHYYDPSANLILEPGMTFTIEPMIAMGSPKEVIWDDGWTASTKDQSRCAQFEHTMVVTNDGVELLTVDEKGGSAIDDLPLVAAVSVL